MRMPTKPHAAGNAMLGLILPVLLALAGGAQAVTLSHTEDFTSTAGRDSLWTSAEWDTIAGEVRLPALGLVQQGSYNTTGTALAGAVSGDVLFVADATGGLVALDIADAASPLLLDVQPTLDQARDMALQGDLAVLAIGTLGLQIIDLSDPQLMTPRGDVDVPGYTTSVALGANLAYLAQSNLGVAVVDISDPDNPAFVRGLLTNDWARGVAIAGGALAVADGAAGLTMLDLSVPDDPTLMGNLDTDGTVLDVTVDGDHAYLAAGSAGMIVVDISNPAQPVQLGSFPTLGTCRHVAVRGDSLYVAGGSGGLYLVDVSDPAQPVQLERADTLGEAYQTALRGGIAWLCDGSEGVHSYLADPEGLDASRNKARSVNINPGGDDVARASLVADYSDSVKFELSVNGGATWAEIAPDGTWLDFPSPGDDLRWRATLVQAGPYPGPILRDLTVTFELILEAAEITAVTDIPADTGGQVRVVFQASVHDTIGDPDQVADYSLYRRFAPDKAYPPGSWDYLLTMPADAEQEYAVVVPTLADSSAAGPAWTAFFVRARTAGGVFYDSPVDSGYSVNNLQPPPPTGFRALPQSGGGHLLSWDPSPVTDFSHFAIYRSSDPDTPVQPATLLGVTQDTGYFDPSDQTWYYQLTVVNLQGQESDPTAAVQPSGLPRVAGLWLGNHPNPFNPVTDIGFFLPAGGSPVELAVYDLRGRLVRRLQEGFLPGGEHHVRWDGRDGHGRELPSGVYSCKLATPAGTKLIKMSLVR